MKNLCAGVIGDTVWDLADRQRLWGVGRGVNALTGGRSCWSTPSAGGALGRIEPLQTEPERDVVRRGERTPTAAPAPRNQDPLDYPQGDGAGGAGRLAVPVRKQTRIASCSGCLPDGGTPKVEIGVSHAASMPTVELIRHTVTGEAVARGRQALLRGRRSGFRFWRDRGRDQRAFLRKNREMDTKASWITFPHFSGGRGQPVRCWRS